MNPLTEGKRVTLGYDYFAKGFTSPQLSEAYYRLSADKEQARLLFETASLDQMDDAYNPGDACGGDENDRMMTTEEMVLEAIRIQHFARTEPKMAALVRVFNGFLKDKGIEAQAPSIGTPKKAGLFATVTVQIPFSDGQVVSIIFHSPDNNKMKITAEDEIIAFRWLLNKRDITHVVSPESDAEVSLQEIGKRTAQLVEKNSARFQVMQKDLIEQKKKLEELKAQTEAAVKQHDDLMGKLKDGQNASEAADAKIANLKDRIDKQKAFNDELQGKIDSLKAKQAGNDGKAAGGDTPKDEAAMKAEQDVAAFDGAKEQFAAELMAMGFSQREEGSFRLDVIDTKIRNGKPMRTSIDTNYFVAEGKITVNAAKQQFSALQKNTAGAFKKALKVLADEKSKVRTVADWSAQYGGVAAKFEVGGQWAVAKNAEKPDEGAYLEPAVVTRLADGVAGSFLPGVAFAIGDHTVVDFDYEEITKYLASGAIKPWGDQAGTADQALSSLDATPGFAEFVTKQDENDPARPTRETVLNIDAVAKEEGLSAQWTALTGEVIGTLRASGSSEVGTANVRGPSAIIRQEAPAENKFKIDTFFRNNVTGGEEQASAIRELAQIIKAAKENSDTALSSLNATAGFAEFVAKQDEGHNEGYSPKGSVLNIDAAVKSEGLEAKWTEGDDDGMPIAVGTFTVPGGNQVGGAQISPDGKSVFLLNGERYRGDYYYATADGETQGAAIKELAVIIKTANQAAPAQEKVGPQVLIGPTMPPEDERRILAELSSLSREELTQKHDEVQAYMQSPDYEAQDPDYKKSLQNTEFLLFTAKSNAPDDQQEPATPDEGDPASVGMLNDILAGNYDNDSTKLGEVLDYAASDLEANGKAAEYDALLNQAADHLTEVLKKEAA